MVAIVALVVMGPKDLPKMLRRLGQWAGKMRRMAADLRAQSGIDDALRAEGLADDINEIRKLARGELDAVQKAARVDTALAATVLAQTAPSTTPKETYARGDDFYVVRMREYPQDGADSYGALPDNAIVYVETLPKSRWARDPLYVMGDANAEVPPEPEPAIGAPADEAVGPEPAPVPYEPPGERTAAEPEPPSTEEKPSAEAQS